MASLARVPLALVFALQVMACDRRETQPPDESDTSTIVPASSPATTATPGPNSIGNPPAGDVTPATDGSGSPPTAPERTSALPASTGSGMNETSTEGDRSAMDNEQASPAGREPAVSSDPGAVDQDE